MTNIFQEHFQQSEGKRMQDVLSFHLSHWASIVTDAVPNRCFDNAWRTFCSFPEIFFKGKFVEGWIVFDLDTEVVLNEHGWCQLPNGTIVDPSVLLLVEPDQPVYYFSGVERDWAEMKVLINEEKELPYVRFDGKHGEDGLGHPVYKAAYETAREKMYHLANATHPPKKMTFLTAQDKGDDPRDTGVSVQIIVVSPDDLERSR